jgi:hypothetical protein
MRWNIRGIMGGIAVTLVTATPLFAQEASPVGTWQTTIQGTDRGVAYVTFSNNLVIAGYGISRDAFGWFDLAGTWDYDAKGKLIGGYTEFIEGGSLAGVLTGKIVGPGRLSANIKSTAGPQKWRAPERGGEIVDLTGAWVSETSTEGTKVLQQFNLAVNPDYPGVFDLTGVGINNNGTFDITGAVIITSDDHAAGFLTATQMANNLDLVLSGKIVKKGNRLKMTGRNANNQDVKLQADRVVATR